MPSNEVSRVGRPTQEGWDIEYRFVTDIPDGGAELVSSPLYYTSDDGGVLVNPFITYDDMSPNRSKKTYVCGGCGSKVDGGDIIQYDDKLWCCECYRRTFISCRHCGHIEKRNEIGVLMFEHLSNGYHYCTRCISESCIHSYNYRPSYNFYNIGRENAPYIGFELEVEGNRNLAYKYMKKLKTLGIADYFYLKHDGSLADSGNGGFEIVSQPCTSRYLHKEVLHKFYRSIAWLQKNNFTSYKSGNCGLHFHVSRANFTYLQTRLMILFFSKCKSKLMKLSLRDAYTMSRWARMPNVRGQKYYIRNSVSGWTNRNKYSAINITQHTIEFRIFRGSLNSNRITALLQFIDALTSYTKSVSRLQFIKPNCWKLFVKWAKQTNRYPHLIKFLKEQKI